MLLPEVFSYPIRKDGFIGDAALPEEDCKPSTTGEYERLCLAMVPEHLREDVPSGLEADE